MNFKILFNRHKKDELLKKHGKRIESNFRSAVLQLSAIQNDAEGVVDNQLRGQKINFIGQSYDKNIKY